MGVDEFRSQATSAPFNMALATLERINEILREIMKVQSNLLIPKEVRQAIKVHLVRSLFLAAVPLLPDKVIDENTEEFKKLRPIEIKVIKKK